MLSLCIVDAWAALLSELAGRGRGVALSPAHNAVTFKLFRTE
jgi:hypothetical protein